MAIVNKIQFNFRIVGLRSAEESSHLTFRAGITQKLELDPVKSIL